MDAWNVYASTLLSARPSQALELFGYQCLITSANLQLPLSAWMTYDIKFHTLVANHSSLRWDICHPDLWLECLTFSKPAVSERWPYPYCNSMYHFPDRCPFCGSSLSTPPNDRQSFSLGTPLKPLPNPQFANLRSRQPDSSTQICRDFNNHGKCNRQPCPFHHCCEHCGGAHPKLFCPNPMGQSSSKR